MIPLDKDIFFNTRGQHKPFNYDMFYQAFSSTNDLFDISQEILDLVTHMMSAEKCSFMMINGQGELYILNARGVEQYQTKRYRVRIGQGVAGKVAAEGHPVLVNNISDDLRFSIKNRSKYKSGSFIACPISSKEEVIGVLNINDKVNGEPFSDEEFDQAKLIAMIASAALKNFINYNELKSQQADIADIFERLLKAENENRKFVAKISHNTRTPLNNIKGALYYLKSSSKNNEKATQEFYEIIEKEVNYLISYFDEGISDFKRNQTDPFDMNVSRF